LRARPILADAMVPLAAGILAGGLTDSRVLGVVAAVVALVGWRATSERTFVVLISLALGAYAGIAAVAWARAPLPPGHLAHRIPRAIASVEGTVVESTPRGERRELIVRAERVRSREGEARVQGLLAITIAHGRAPWPAGARVRVTTRLRRPRNFGNPGGYDYAGALARQGIFVTAFLWDDEALTELSPQARPTWEVLPALREHLGAALARVSDPAARGYLRAVLLGEADALDPETRDALTRTGLAHVVSVSGFHVAVVAGAGVLAVRWLLRRVPALLARGDAGKLALASGLPLVLLYGAIAGGSVPALRASTMYALLLAARLGDRPPDPLRTLAAVAALLALRTPGIAADVSFALSLTSVAAIVLLLGRRGRRSAIPATPWRRLARTFVAEPVLVSLAATLATAPLLALHFQQVSLVAPLANLLGLPLLGPATLVPGLIALPLVPIVPALADRLLALAAAAAALGLGLARGLARLPWAAVAVPLPSAIELSLCYAGLGLSFVRAGAIRRGLVLAVLSVAVVDAGYWTYVRWLDPSLRVTFLSVGQGDAAVVELPRGRVVVVDGGGLPGAFDPGERVVAPFLRARKIMRVDVLALSHPQQDHYEGLAYLAEHFHPREFWSNGSSARAAGFARLEAGLERAGTRRLILHAGDVARTDPDTRLEALHPALGARGLGVNDASLVLRVVHGDVAVLLTGDVEAGGETALVGSGVPLASAVLKVAHHGSDTSSTARFLRTVTPRIAVVSAGYENRFGFPAPAVVERLAAAGAVIWRTDRDGAVRVVSDGATITVRGWDGGWTRASPAP
jgi:competence protein ComEC